MNPLKEAQRSSEHIGLTLFPQAFDLWNVSPLVIFQREWLRLYTEPGALTPY